MHSKIDKFDSGNFRYCSGIFRYFSGNFRYCFGHVRGQKNKNFLAIAEKSYQIMIWVVHTMKNEFVSSMALKLWIMSTLKGLSLEKGWLPPHLWES